MYMCGKQEKKHRGSCLITLQFSRETTHTEPGAKLVPASRMEMLLSLLFSSPAVGFRHECQV